jgi:hypothetical protein
MKITFINFSFLALGFFQSNGFDSVSSLDVPRSYIRQVVETGNNQDVLSIITIKKSTSKDNKANTRFSRSLKEALASCAPCTESTTSVEPPADDKPKKDDAIDKPKGDVVEKEKVKPDERLLMVEDTQKIFDELSRQLTPWMGEDVEVDPIKFQKAINKTIASLQPYRSSSVSSNQVATVANNSSNVSVPGPSDVEERQDGIFCILFPLLCPEVRKDYFLVMNEILLSSHVFIFVLYCFYNNR